MAGEEDNAEQAAAAEADRRDCLAKLALQAKVEVILNKVSAVETNIERTLTLIGDGENLQNKVVAMWSTTLSKYADMLELHVENLAKITKETQD